MTNVRTVWIPAAILCVSALAVTLLTPPGSAKDRKPDAAHGKQVFDEHCAACHNKSEKVGSYLADDMAYFIKAGVPAQAFGTLLRKPVRNRPPGSRMPAYTPEEISDADLDDIGLHLASGKSVSQTPITPGSPEQGGKLYSAHCSSCHGGSGQGVGEMLPVAVMANQLKEARVPPNVMLGFVLMSSRSGSVPGMPTFSAETLSDKDLADIAAHIWSMPMPSRPEDASNK